MSKSVLISIQPYWVFLIIAKKMGWNIGKEKTVEIRKNYPKAETWDKTTKIYCSRDKKSFARIPKEYQPLMERLLGKVIGEFVCNEISELYIACEVHDELPSRPCEYWLEWDGEHDIPNESCLTAKEIMSYLGTSDYGYAWHISDLKIYDKPRELSEFGTFCKSYYDGDRCDDCKYFIDGRGYEYDESDCGCDGLKPIERPPMSWCYVEEVEK